MIRCLLLLLAITSAYAENVSSNGLIPELEEVFASEGIVPQLHDGIPQLKAPIFSENNLIDLSDAGKLIADVLPRDRLPFADFRTNFGVSAGYKLLWSHLFLLSQLKVFSQKLLIKSEDFEVGLQHDRIYPFLLDATKPQIFREKLSVVSPEALAGYHYLSFRLTQEDDEPLWTKTPDLEKAVRLAGSLRNDNLLNLFFSLNDLLIFSARPDSYTPKLIGEAEYLVPFKNLKANTEIEKNACKLVYSDSGSSLDGILAGLKFVKRKLLKLELIPRDPYSTNGSELVYFDSETLIPVAKLLYSRDTEKYKFLLGVMQPVNSAIAMLPAETIVFDLLAKQKKVLKIKDFNICDGYTANASYAAFDPSVLK